MLIYICYLALYFIKAVEKDLNIIYSIQETLNLASSTPTVTQNPEKQSNAQFVDPSVNSGVNLKSQWLTIAMAVIV